MISPSHFGTTLGMMAAAVRGEDVRNWALYFLPVLVIGVGAMVWAAFLRKTTKRRKRIHRPHTWELGPEELRAGPRSGRSGHRRHGTRRPSRHNPTLAETGGLPPARPDGDLPEPPPASR